MVKQADVVALIALLPEEFPGAMACADYNVNGHLAVGVSGEFERLQRVETGELLIDASRRIEAGHDARDSVAPVRKLFVFQRHLLPQRGGVVGPAFTQHFY
jgi:hypothetical protein